MRYHVLFLGIGLLLTASSHAHFQTLLPNTETVATEDEKNIVLSLMFTHPMEQSPLMSMAMPAQFGVFLNGKKQDLLAQLVAQKNPEGEQFFQAKYTLTQPGDHIFFVEPAPYWEADEGKLIVHYTKVVVDAFEGESTWDQLLGLPVEIEPLVRPYGLWTGNLFRGIVRHNGNPVPFAEIEVEYLNEDKVKIPASPFITQVIKADAQGVFSYAMPRAGWWGFAALIDAESPQKNPDGQLVPVELGGLIWVKTRDMTP
jgi:cobalt/nickel transport protein